MTVVKAVHQIDSLEKDALVLDAELSSNLKEPVNNSCTEVSRDVDLVGHERLKLLLVLIGTHVFKLLLTVEIEIVVFIGPNELLEALLILF